MTPYDFLMFQDEIVDFVYTMPVVGHPLRPSIGNQIKVTTSEGKIINVVVTDILDDILILKRSSKKQRTGRGKVPLSKVYFKPNDRNLFNICHGISALQLNHLEVLFPIHECNENGIPNIQR